MQKRKEECCRIGGCVARGSVRYGLRWTVAAWLALCAGGPGFAAGVAAGVVADGGTKTSVSVGATGRVTVGIAPAIAGVSHNTFRDFNVSATGVELDNRSASARNIIAQVTGTGPSVLAGPLSVLGSRANVIVANPNGVSVNGLSVSGIGNLALTTGQVSFNNFTTANGQLQRNVVLTTGQGSIDIGPSGLTGALLNLELIARHIRVNGAVANLYDDPKAKVRLIAGSSRAEIDSSISPTDNLTPWIAYTGSSAPAGPGIAIDITAAGSLASGRIELLVTNRGAGVRHAGAAMASAGDFVVAGSGDLQFSSGTIQARRDVLVATDRVTGDGRVGAGRNVHVTSDKVALIRSHLTAGTEEPGSIVIGSRGQAHSVPVSLAESILDAQGGIGILDAGAGAILAGTKATATGNVLVDTRDLTMQAASIQSSGAAVEIDAVGAYVQHDSSVLAATDARIRAGAVAIRSTDAQSIIVARTGGVLVKSRSGVSNTGGLIQGKSRIAGEMLSTGAVAVRAAGDVLNQSTPTYLSILFGTDDDVDVAAGGNIVNRYGRMLSNGYLRLLADGDVTNEVTHQAGLGSGHAQTWSGTERRWLVLSKRSAGLEVDYGRIDRPDQIAYLLSDKGTTISGRNVTNYGGEIYANDGAIRIAAIDTFRTEGVATGSAHYARSCLFVCRTSASSTTGVTGGLLSAGSDIDIRAGRRAVNAGGRVLALGNLTVTAPVTYASGITGYTAIARDRGFKAFFGDSWSRLYAQDVGGSWMASGRTRINGDAVTHGGSFDGEVDITGQSTVDRARQRDPVAIENHLGLTSWVWQ